MDGSAKTDMFNLVVEDDSHEDGRQAYHAHCPALEQYGASTWGNTREEALQHIQEVVQMIVQELNEEGALLREGPLQDVEVFSEPLEAKILAQKPFREILAPVREGFQESGITDDELAALVEKAREDFQRERPTEDE